MDNDMTVLLLAGGKSTRFWPLPHKMTLTFLGKTLLEWQIDLLKKTGFKNILVMVSSDIRGQIGDSEVKIVEQKGDGQGAAILSAEPFIAEEPLLVINGDDIVSEKLFADIIKTVDGRHNILVGYKTGRYFPGGYLELNGTKIARIHEKPGEGNEPSSYVRLVCDYFVNGRLLIDLLKKNKPEDPDHLYEDVLSMAIKEGMEFEMLEYEGTWIPIKYPWHTLSAMEYFLNTITQSSIDKTARIHKSASIVGPVLIEKGARVMEYAKLVGPLYVGAGSIIGNHTMVRFSLIGENSVIGFGSDVTRSYIGNNSWFHSNYIGDSVIADNVGMGAGAVLANLRLDEGEVYSTIKGERVGTRREKLGAMVGAGARIGVEARLMPGVKVGKNSVVGPGILLQEDLPDNKRCYIKQSLTIQDNPISNIRDRDRFREKI